MTLAFVELFLFVLVAELVVLVALINKLLFWAELVGCGRDDFPSFLAH